MTTTTTTIDTITALERSYDELTIVVSGLGEHGLPVPTNCPEWDVRGLLNHILGGALMYIGVNRGEALGEDAGDVVGHDPSAAVAQIAAANLASWRSAGALDGERVYPWATVPAPWGLIINVGEVALHTWDLANATGQPATIDADVAQIVYDFYRQIPMDGMRAGGVYGPEIAVADSAPIQDRLLAFLSRQP
jgi:uncharacterized protein (TIGR03086 family)